MGIGGGGFGYYGGGGSPVGVQMTRGPSGTGGVLPFDEFLRLPGVGVFLAVTRAPYREVNSMVATAPKLKVEDKGRVNNSRRINRLNLISLS